MYIIAGLGNPGKKYDNTRHNIGFAVIDELARRYGTDISKKECQGLTGSLFISGQKVLLLKPQTYMNLSGESIRALADYYKVDSSTSVIVAVDDINLETGRLRIRSKGSAGGHNGLKSIIAHLGHDNFTRIRIGVGENSPRENLIDHVLGHFSKEDRSTMETAVSLAADAIETILSEGTEAAMNKYNKKIEPSA